jgi:hypothetical protein
MSKAIATTTNILSGDRVNVQLSWMKEDFQFSYASTQLNFVPKSAQRILMEQPELRQQFIGAFDLYKMDNKLVSNEVNVES